MDDENVEPSSFGFRIETHGLSPMAFPDPFPVAHWPQSAWECEGLEFDWFCADKNGELAVFTSAGRGFIPPGVFQAGVDACNDFIKCIASRTPCEALLVTHESGSFRDWRLLAEHGLYAFDFQDVHRTHSAEKHSYDLIYRPSQPAIVSELSEAAKRGLPCVATAFSESTFFPVAELPQT